MKSHVFCDAGPVLCGLRSCLRLRTTRYGLILIILLGLAAETQAALLFDRGDAGWRWRPGTNEASTPVALWRALDFNDAQFTTAPAPFWYDTTGDSSTLPGGTQIAGMQNIYGCIFLRKAFVTTNVSEIAALRLSALVDDGLVVWINGAEVQRVSMADPPGTAVATSTLAQNAIEPVSFITYDLLNPSAYLVNGTNIIAVQVFQSALNSSDLGFDASLEAILVETTPPTIVGVSPTRNSTVDSLSAIAVAFSEPVTGVDAFDLRINGAPATTVTALSSSSYEFSFLQPAYGTVQITWDPTHGIADQALPPNPFDAAAPGASWQYTLVDNTPPLVASLTPAAGATVRALTNITVQFSENVSGVDAADLRINGSPAAGLVTTGPSLYRFTFPEPSTGVVQVAWVAGHGITDQAAIPNAFAGGNWSYTLDPNAGEGSLYISEFVASNTRTLDDFNDASDWIEIYNPSPLTVNLDGWSLTDDAGNLTKWRFPATNLAGGAFLVVFASERDRRVPGARLHTNFRLLATGEYLALVTPEGAIASQFSPMFPTQVPNVSYGFVQSGNPPFFTAATNGSYFTTPTPGSANVLGGTNLPGPVIQNVMHTPHVPLDQDDLLVTAEVFPSFGLVTNVTMRYRIMFTNEVTVPMFDDGAHGDGVAGDGRYGATIPQNVSTNGQMIRYYISATDANGRPARWPLFTSSNSTAQYLGTVVNPGYVTSKLPIIHLFAPANVLQPPGPNSTQTIGADSQNGGRVSVFYDGEFYDNVHMALRGNTTAGYNKKSHRLEFNREHLFRHTGAGYGIPDRPAPRISETSFVADYPDPAYMRQGLSFWLCDLIGSPGSFYYPVRLQLNGQFYQLANHNDVHGNDLLDRLGYDPRGALYNAAGVVTAGQFSTGGFEKKTREFEGAADYTALANAIAETLSLGARTTNFFENFDVANALNYLVVGRWAHENDDVWANMSLYHDNDGDNLWRIIGFDMNLSWGAIYYEGGTPSVIEGVQSTNDIHKAHPLYGASSTPALSGPGAPNNYNRVYDTTVLSPRLREMFLRRMRTMMDSFVKPPGTPAAELTMEKKVLEWRDVMAPEAQLDRTVWGWPPKGGQGNFDPPPNSGNFGTAARTNAAIPALTNAVNALISEFIVKRRLHFYGKHCVTNASAAFAVGITKTNNAGIPLGQPLNSIVVICGVEANPSTGNQAQEFVCLTNANPFAIDLSEWELDGAARFTFKPGTVMSSGSVLYVSPDVRAFRARTTSPRGGQGLFIVGPYEGQLSARGEMLRLTDNRGRPVHTFTYAGNPTPAQLQLRITELMYHPAPGGAYGSEEYEYIELKNISLTTTLDLTGVHFSGGIEFSFTGSAVTSLAPGQRVLVVKNLAAFTARYGSGLNVAGQYLGTLDNAGENIRLDDGVGEKVLDFDYNNAWYPITDGQGFSLVIVNENASWDTWGVKASWRASGTLGGTPSQGEPPAPVFASILINEVLTHSVSPAVDAVELWNPTATNVNIGGWFITDDFTNAMKFRIPNGTIIPAGEYLVFDENDFNPTNPLSPTGFAFSSRGDEVFLFSGDANTNLTGYVHGFDFGAAEPGVAFGRYITSVGEEHFVAQTSNSLGSTNAGPKVGPVIINEIHYRPPDLPDGSDNSGDEFIELRNISGAPVPLFHPTVGTNTWRLRGGVEFDFPTNRTLSSGGYLLLVNFDPTDDAILGPFRAKFNVPLNVPIFGPYSGKLNNAGDTVSLSKPDATATNSYILVDRVRYQDSAPWATAGDGAGASLQRLGATAYGDDPINWDAALPTGGQGYPGGTAPLLTSEPVSQSGVTSASIMFTASATGAAPLKYQWRFNGSALPGETNSTLMLANLQPNHAGDYSVVVFNGAGSVESTNATLTVLIPADILVQPANQAVFPLTNVTFSVFAVSSTPLSYQWRFNGTPIPGATAASYPIVGVQPANEGDYSVAVTDAVGTIQSAAGHLTVVTHPIFTLQATNRTILLGTNATNVTLTAAATSTTPVRYQWRFLPAGQAGNAMDLLNATNASLTISNVQSVHSGTYTVVATDSYGSVTSDPAILSVLVKPVITQQPLSVSVVANGTATFTIAASGTRPITFRWRKNNLTFTNAIFVTTPSNSTLILTNVSSGDAASFNVAVTNIAGQAPGLSANAVLTVLADSDGDGIPDTLEPLDGAADTDGDGMSNAAEYFAGTDYLDATSFLKVNIAPSGIASLSFIAVSNRTYTVQYTESLSPILWKKLGDVLARDVSRTEALLDPNAGTNRYYRLVTPIQR